MYIVLYVRLITCSISWLPWYASPLETCVSKTSSSEVVSSFSFWTPVSFSWPLSSCSRVSSIKTSSLSCSRSLLLPSSLWTSSWLLPSSSPSSPDEGMICWKLSFLIRCFAYDFKIFSLITFFDFASFCPFAW